MDSLIQLSERIEQVSVNYARKAEIERTPDWFILKLQEELGELTQAYLRTKGLARTNGKSSDDLKRALAEETADVLCHALLFAKHNNVDLERAIQEKWLRYL